ncbi:MAG: ketopantoate reductase family protein [Smithella sp.]
MNICFFGVGGVGGYYGALLTKYVNETCSGNTYFIARGGHKDAIFKNGLLLKKDGGREEILVRPYLCSETVDDLPVFDLVVVSVKGYDLDNATRELTKITDKNSVILPLLNGADIYERLRRNVREGFILPSCLYLSAHIESPGVVFQTGGSGQIAIGKDPQYPEFYPDNLMNLFKNADIPITFFEDVNTEIWTKYIFIASFALVTATYNKTIGEIVCDEKLSILVKDIMRETLSIASALKINLPLDIVENTFSKASQFPFETKTSFQRDVELKGRQSEWDLLGGTIIRYADKFDIPVNTTKDTLMRLLRDLP